MKTEQGSVSSSSSGRCGVSSVTEASSLSQKLQISERAFVNRSPGELSVFNLDRPGRRSMEDDILLDRDTKLIAVVDHECTRNRRGHYSSRLPSQEVTSARTLEVENSDAGTKILSNKYRLTQDTSLSELKRKISEDPCLVLLTEDVIHRTMAVPNDTQYANQGHLTSATYLRFAAAYDKLYVSPAVTSSSPVTVAIIDTGVDIDHVDLNANVWTNTTETANGLDDDGNGYVDDLYGYNFPSAVSNPRPDLTCGSDCSGNYHGTHVAGLSAAVTDNSAGVSGVLGKRVKIMALNVFGSSNGAYTSDIDNAITYAYQKGAKVINLSLGSLGATPSTKAAIAAAIANGAVVVAAAGNDAFQLDTYSSSLQGYYCTYPAAYAKDVSGFVSVGAIDSNTGLRAKYSNYSTSYVEIGAPGSQTSYSAGNCSGASTGGLLSTLPGNTYGRACGTSMASPVVAGGAAAALALKQALGGSYTPAQIESLLLSSGQSVSGLSTVFKDGKVMDLKTLVDTISP